MIFKNTPILSQYLTIIVKLWLYIDKSGKLDEAERDYMLIEFSVSNYKSFKIKQTLTMQASKIKELEANTFETATNIPIKLLNSSALYGANASGKSNLIKAIRFMKAFVMSSAKESSQGQKNNVTPFLFDTEFSEKPSEFEVIFVVEGIKFQYGFALDGTRVTEEWLFAFPKGKPQRWYIRVYDEKLETYQWDFSSYFQGKKTALKEFTRHNTLFLSSAINLNNDQLKPVYDWFQNKLQVSGSHGYSSEFTANKCINQSFKNKVLSMLESADVGISDLKLDIKKVDMSALTPDLTKELIDKIIDKDSENEVVDVKTIHLNEKNEKVELDIEDESDGTKKLFSFAGPVIDTLESGIVLIVDELHSALHPKVVKMLVQLFHNKDVNKSHAQLIFSTHETSILDQNIFRRDQVWFVQKTRGDYSELNPLLEYSPRKGAENIEKGYLEGRYGGLPYTNPRSFVKVADGQR